MSILKKKKPAESHGGCRDIARDGIARKAWDSTNRNSGSMEWIGDPSNFDTGTEDQPSTLEVPYRQSYLI